MKLWESLVSRTCLALLLLSSSTGQAQQRHSSRISRRPRPPVSKSPGIKWYTFRGPDQDFTLDFPNPPKRMQDLPGAITITRQFALATESYFLAISISDFGGAPDDPKSNDWGQWFEQDYAKLIREDGTRLLQFHRIAKNIYEVEGWTPASRTGSYQHFLSRNVLKDARHYRIGCNSLIIDQEVDKKLCRRFFNSFRIIGSSK